jgi:AraC-like DNA-binding protein
MACFCAKAQAAAGRRVVPVHIAFAQPQPRSFAAFAETFGTRQIDFGAPITTITLQAADVAAPMPSADPVLAAILRRYAKTIPFQPTTTWRAQFQGLLDEAVAYGNPSLDTLARRLGISTRTLQRELAKSGTSWRAELDAARQRRAEHARQAGEPSMAMLARLLGYADARSLRRAMRRWNGQQPPEPAV